MKQRLSESSGWGLIQWTPSTILTKWAKERQLEWYEPETQLKLIIEEGENSEAYGVWIPTKRYPYTWEEFCNLTDIDEATRAYEAIRERAGKPNMKKRLEYAHKWYDFISTYYVNKILRIESESEKNGTRERAIY